MNGERINDTGVSRHRFIVVMNNLTISHSPLDMMRMFGQVVACSVARRVTHRRMLPISRVLERVKPYIFIDIADSATKCDRRMYRVNIRTKNVCVRLLK